MSDLIDCEKLTGRLRDICRGVDDSGRPVLTPQKRAAYLRLWGHSEAEIKSQVDQAAPRGLGDRIANGIKRVTRGRVKPCTGCQRRAATLNHYFPSNLPPLQALRYGGPVRRNLLYHVYPVRGEAWRWNVEQLLERIDLFNGRRIVAIVTDAATEDAAAVKALFPAGVEFVERKNKKRLGEAVTFPELLRRVMDDDPDAITFYAHAKGVSRKPSEWPTIQRWADAMYAACLDDIAAVERELVAHGVAGGYRRLQKLGKARWYYSGTFYWFRHAHVAGRNWEYVEKKYWGVESWPGTLFRREEAAVLAADDVKSLYQPREWERIDSLRKQLPTVD